MPQDSQYNYRVNVFDNGSVKKLTKEFETALKTLRKFEETVTRTDGKVMRLLNLEQLSGARGFGPSYAVDRKGLKAVAGGGSDTERKTALMRAEIARRDVRVADQILKLKEDAYRRLKRNFANLDRAQLDALTDAKRQKFLDKQITSKKSALLKLEAAKLRAGLAFERDLNFIGDRRTKEGRSLRQNLGQAHEDVLRVEKEVAAYTKLSNLKKGIEKLQVRQNAALDRANILRHGGNRLEASKEILVAKQAKAKILELRQEKLTSQELRAQVRLNQSIERSKQRIKTLATSGRQPLDPIERRLQDGGASLFRIQAQLLLNYAAMGTAIRGIGFALRFVVDLDKEFAQLQAITATTDESMGKLEKTIIRVSERVKFTALEVAQAATIMGQAGFSVDQIVTSISSITLLATAVGTDLKTAVDLVTSTLAVFNLRAEESARLANTFTTAVNNSKLNLEKLTLGLQYAGNIANEQNISFTELTSVLGAMANSGIRAGSTLGTGLRQVLIAFASPSAKLEKRLRRFNLTLEDVNVKLHGITGVLKTLRKAGFTTTDALQSLEVRAGAAFAALTNNLDVIDELRRKSLLAASATQANAVQMEALANKAARLKSIFGTVVASALAPLVAVSKVFVDALGLLLIGLNKLGFALPAVGAAFGLLIAAIASYRAYLITTNIASKVTIASLFGKAAAAKLAAAGFTTLTRSLALVAVPLAAITAAFYAATWAIDKLVVTNDELKSKIDESSGRIDAYNENIRSIQKETLRLQERYFDLSEDMDELNTLAYDLQLKFGDLGGAFDFTSASVEGLSEELQRLHNQMLRMKSFEIGEQILNNAKLLSRAEKHLIEKSINVRSYAGLTNSDPLVSEPINYSRPPGGFSEHELLNRQQLLSDRIALSRQWAALSEEQSRSTTGRGLSLYQFGSGLDPKLGSLTDRLYSSVGSTASEEGFVKNYLIGNLPRIEEQFLALIEVLRLRAEGSVLGTQQGTIDFELSPEVSKIKEELADFSEQIVNIEGTIARSDPIFKEKLHALAEHIDLRKKEISENFGDSGQLAQLTATGILDEFARLASNARGTAAHTPGEFQEGKVSRNVIIAAIREEIEKLKKATTDSSSADDTREATEKVRLLNQQLGAAQSDLLEFILAHNKTPPFDANIQRQGLSSKHENEAALNLQHFFNLWEVHKEFPTKELRTAFSALKTAFKESETIAESIVLEARKDFDNFKVQRTAMDAEVHRGRYGQVHRTILDRRIKQQEVTLNQAEIARLTEEIANLKTIETGLEDLIKSAQKEILTNKKLLDNYDKETGGNNQP